MVQITEQLSALNKSQLESVVKAASLAVDNAEKFADLQLKWGKATYEDAVKALRQIASIKDVSELGAYSTSAVQPAWDKASAYAKSVYELVSSAQAEYAALVEEQVAEFNKNVVVTLDAALRSAPAGSEGAVSAVKSAVSSANALYESLIKAAKQVNTITEANIAAVNAQVTTATKRKATAA
jgi:phasin family protein